MFPLIDDMTTAHTRRSTTTQGAVELELRKGRQLRELDATADELLERLRQLEYKQAIEEEHREP
jgi:hypothetical protein